MGGGGLLWGGGGECARAASAATQNCIRCGLWRAAQRAGTPRWSAWATCGAARGGRAQGWRQRRGRVSAQQGRRAQRGSLRTPAGLRAAAAHARPASPASRPWGDLQGSRGQRSGVRSAKWPPRSRQTTPWAGANGSALSAASAGALLSRSGSSCSASDPPSCNSTGSVTLGGARAALGALSTRERAGPAPASNMSVT